MTVGLDKENHSVFVLKPYDTLGPSPLSKPKGEIFENVSALHRTGKNSGPPLDKRNAIVLKSRRSVSKNMTKSPISRKKNGIPCEILDELELERLLEVEDGAIEEGGMEETEVNAQFL